MSKKFKDFIDEFQHLSIAEWFIILAIILILVVAMYGFMEKYNKPKIVLMEEEWLCLKTGTRLTPVRVGKGYETVNKEVCILYQRK